MGQETTKRITMRPLDLDKRFTKFSNPVIDYIMPRVSPTAWKVLTVIWRHTEGCVEDRGTGKRKQWDEISYSLYVARASIRSSTAMREADTKRLLSRPAR